MIAESFLPAPVEDGDRLYIAGRVHVWDDASARVSSATYRWRTTGGDWSKVTRTAYASTPEVIPPAVCAAVLFAVAEQWNLEADRAVAAARSAKAAAGLALSAVGAP